MTVTMDEIEIPVRVRTTYVGDQRTLPPQYATTAVASQPYPSFASAGVIGLILVTLAIIGGAFLMSANRAPVQPEYACPKGDADCWKYNADAEREKQLTKRAIANANANARAGFGNDDETTKQHAVLPWPKQEIDQTVRTYQPEIPALPPLAPCGTCGAQIQGNARATVDGNGHCTLHGAGHAGEIGYIWSDGRCHVKAPTT